jgi:hypothetical protein
MKFKLMLSLAVAFVAINAVAETKKTIGWSLERSLDRLMNSSEFVKATEEASKASKSLTGTSRLPNPELEIGYTDEFSVQTGTEGFDRNAIILSQRFPIADLFYGNKISKNKYQASLLNAEDLKLNLKFQFSNLYYELQYKQALLDLSSKELSLIKSGISKKGQKLVRFQNSLDKGKLNLIESRVNIERMKIEEEIHELTAQIKTYLGLDETISFSVTQIAELPSASKLNLSTLEDHPKVKQIDLKKKMLKMQISQQQLNRFGDIEISAFNQKEFIFNKPVDTRGALIKFTIPLWDWKNANIDSLKYNEIETNLKGVYLKKNLKSKKKIILEHYSHLLNIQNLISSSKVPKARRLMNKTIQSYSVGQVSILSLIDSYKEYIDSKKENLEVIFSGWKEIAEFEYYNGGNK